MTETPPYDIEITQVFDAPPERVYQAFTDPDQFAEWYGPVGFPVDRDTVELDARVGGRQRFAMVSEADPSIRTGFDGRFTVVVQNVLLSSRGAWDGIPGQAGAWPSNLRAEFPRQQRQDTARSARGPSPARNGRSGPPGVGDDAPQTGVPAQRLTPGAVLDRVLQGPGGPDEEEVHSYLPLYSPGACKQFEKFPRRSRLSRLNLFRAGREC
jgi:uncharacterized protein YndB with AHSA1/START domain